MARSSTRSVQFLGEEWRAELGLDGLTLRSSGGRVWRFPPSDVFEARSVLDGYQSAGVSGLVAPDTVPRESLPDWLRTHGTAYLLGYFFGDQEAQSG